MAGLETELLGVKMRNPTVLASGLLGTSAAIMKRAYEEGGAGAVTMKSIGPIERAGNANPTMFGNDVYFINAVGLPNPGYKNMEEEWTALNDRKFPLIASIFGFKVDEFVEVAADVTKRKIDALELNISCPNVKQGGATFGVKPELAAEVVAAVKKVSGKVPLIAKLTPNTAQLKEVAVACVDAGADILSAINTVGPGMQIDINTGKPVLAFRTGGVSGPAVKPIAIRCVYEMYDATQHKVPIIGMGGMMTGEDAIEMMMAGASAVGVGSGVYYRGITVFKQMCDEMESWMKEHGYKNVKELVGSAHEVRGEGAHGK